MTWKWRTLTNNHIAFDGTEKEFDEWKASWFRDVPKCEEFVCCHELMSCGIAFACGDCSIYSTMAAGRAVAMCDIVGCPDCMKKSTCTKSMNTKIAPRDDAMKLTDADRDGNLFIRKTVSLPDCDFRDEWLNCTKEDDMDCIELLEFDDCPLEKDYDDEISLCSECSCMTKTVNGVCGKCGAERSGQGNLVRKERQSLAANTIHKIDE